MSKSERLFIPLSVLLERMKGNPLKSGMKRSFAITFLNCFHSRHSIINQGKEVEVRPTFGININEKGRENSSDSESPD